MSTIYSAIDRGDALIYDGVAYAKKGQSYGNITSGGVYGQTDIGGVTFTLDDSGVEGGSNHRVWTPGEWAIARYVAENQGFKTFTPVTTGEPGRAWGDISRDPTTGDIYALAVNDDVYRQIAGSGQFLDIDTGLANPVAMCCAPNGDLYVAQNLGYIYVRRVGTSNFVSTGSSGTYWNNMFAAPNGDIYATIDLNSCSYFYKQTGGQGNFNLILSNYSQDPCGCVAPNGDVYLSTTSAIWIKPFGQADFQTLDVFGLSRKGMASAPNGDIYLTVNGGDIYVRYGGVGSFVALGQASRAWRQPLIDPDYLFRFPVYNDSIYVSTPIFEKTVSSSGVARVYHTGAGTGAFRISIDDTLVAMSDGNIPLADAIPAPISSGHKLSVFATSEVSVVFLPAVYP